MLFNISDYITGFSQSFAPWADHMPWQITAQMPTIIEQLLMQLPHGEYEIVNGVAWHHSAVIEPGAILKAPLIIGAGCFIAAHSYLRGGNWLAPGCTIGPGVELKSSYIGAGTRVAHFNFIGDSVIGTEVNFEAGSIICNYRNERPIKTIHISIKNELIAINADKFGALVGDHCRIGANAVLAPGSLLQPESIVQRATLCDPELNR